MAGFHTHFTLAFYSPLISQFLSCFVVVLIYVFLAHWYAGLPHFHSYILVPASPWIRSIGILICPLQGPVLGSVSYPWSSFPPCPVSLNPM
ncbi:hypothetical protein PLICRDRAFT_347906 [Plicaturopsis crispa FD-325 SS-3]|uniref:Uncharacterized protein n=1 Tax=Plicaturopsis crispa FD-325 SS-3 TaxID=944288 RepID=A0A0C9SRQ5_PLICR|nr:hypothetical protein PLICRDRAFT_347906 [Plicaturopsis crispa FD-325 SS-3]